MKKIRHCAKCLMLETRPRITFNDKGVCGACQWAEEKKTSVDWEARWKELEYYCDKYRSKSGNFDCIIPVSGGKDSCYVSYMMKEKMGMHPLLLHVCPPLPFTIGNENLETLIQYGFDCIKIQPNPQIDRMLAKETLVNYGQPQFPWMHCVQVAALKTAISYNIPLIMWGEEGETEYGGTKKIKNTPTYDAEYIIGVYLSGVNFNQYLKKFSENQLFWWLFPTGEEIRRADLVFTHWSYFENWDPYRNYLVSKEKIGLKSEKKACVGTYNNFAQTDTPLYDLHAYFMFLKFGFGRTSQDACIDIRRGALAREQAIELVRRFDGKYPEPYIDTYLDYYGMTREEFEAVVDQWANKDILIKKDGRWVKNFEIG